MSRKFSVGDKARIAPERLRNYYPPGVRPGRIVTIKGVVRGAHGVKCYYMIGDNGKGTRGHLFRSDDLRPIGAHSLRGRSSKP